jgi:hypothetical protein
VTINFSRVKQDTQIRSSTIIDYKIYSITNLDNKCEVRHSWPSISWLPLSRAISSFMQFLHRRSYFWINGNLCQIHKICYKCLTWNIYNLYIKYIFLGLTISLAIRTTFTALNRVHNPWKVNDSPCKEEVNTTPHLLQFHLSSSRRSRWGTHESYHGFHITL